MGAPTTSHGLLERARTGDQAAFDSLFGRYRRRLAVLLRYKLPPESRQPEDIDDLLQEIFTEAFSNLSAFDYRGPGSFFAWLCRIAGHALLDHARYLGRARRKGEAVPFRSESNPGGPDPADSRTPSRLLAREQALEQLLQKLDTLPDDYRQAILLTKIEGLTTSEMAARLGKSPQAAAVLLHRALARFRAAARSEP